jgi:hypothetical protein
LGAIVPQELHGWGDIHAREARLGENAISRRAESHVPGFEERRRRSMHCNTQFHVTIKRVSEDESHWLRKKLKKLGKEGGPALTGSSQAQRSRSLAMSTWMTSSSNSCRSSSSRNARTSTF